MELEELWVMKQGGLMVMDLGELLVMALVRCPWMLEQGLAELVAEGMSPVEQSSPLNMPQIFCTEMLKFILAILHTHPGCTVLLSITCWNNGLLKNNYKALYI